MRYQSFVINLVCFAAVVYSLGAGARHFWAPRGSNDLKVVTAATSPAVYAAEGQGYAFSYDQNIFRTENGGQANSPYVYVIPKAGNPNDIYNRIMITVVKSSGNANATFDDMVASWKGHYTDGANTTDRIAAMGDVQKTTSGLAYRSYVVNSAKYNSTGNGNFSSTPCAVNGYLVNIEPSHNGRLLDVYGSCNVDGLITAQELNSIAASVTTFPVDAKAGQGLDVVTWTSYN